VAETRDNNQGVLLSKLPSFSLYHASTAFFFFLYLPQLHGAQPRPAFCHAPGPQPSLAARREGGLRGPGRRFHSATSATVGRWGSLPRLPKSRAIGFAGNTAYLSYLELPANPMARLLPKPSRGSYPPPASSRGGGWSGTEAGAVPRTTQPAFPSCKRWLRAWSVAKRWPGLGPVELWEVEKEKKRCRSVIE